jgi:WD40 repeat protein
MKMWCGQGGKLLKTMTGGGTTRVWSVVGDGTRKRIVSGDHAGVIRIFSIESGACTEVLFSAPGGVRLALWAGVLLAGCGDNKIRSWDLSVGSASMREFKDVKSADSGQAWCLVVQEGVGRKRLISHDTAGKVRLWDVEEARCLSVLPCDRDNRRPLVGQVLAADLHRLVYADGTDMKMLDLSLSALDLSVVSVA